jgi:hypothetical protein
MTANIKISFLMAVLRCGEVLTKAFAKLEQLAAVMKDIRTKH